MRDVQLVRLTENKGFAGANNIAIKLASDCDWIALINPDAHPDPEWLEQILAATRAFPDYPAFGCKMLTAANPDLIDGAGDVYHVSGLV